MAERTVDGLEAARARGCTGGQKPKLGPRQVQLPREVYDSGELTVQQITDEFGVTMAGRAAVALRSRPDST